MILELVGLLAGGAARLLPEWLRHKQNEKDNDHEYRMAKLSGDLAKEGGEMKLRALDREYAGQAEVKDIDALIEAVRAQGRQSGNKFADAMNQLARPVSFFWMLGLYSVQKAAVIVIAILVAIGVDNTALDVAKAIVDNWTPQDQAMLNSMVSFWYVDRSLRKGGGVSPAH